MNVRMTDKDRVVIALSKVVGSPDFFKKVRNN